MDSSVRGKAGLAAMGKVADRRRTFTFFQYVTKRQADRVLYVSHHTAAGNHGKPDHFTSV